MGKASTIQQMAYGLRKIEMIFAQFPPPCHLVHEGTCVYIYMYMHISNHKKVEDMLLASLSCSPYPSVSLSVCRPASLALLPPARAKVPGNYAIAILI